jgi:protein O-GlcNAc transferase
MRLFRLTRNFRFAIVLIISPVLVASLAATDNSQQLKSADVAFHAGYAAEQSGDLPSAKRQFEKVVQLAPDIAEGHSALGSVLVQLGEYKQAIRELARALALKPWDRTSQINLAIAYEQSGDHDKSLVWFKSLDRNTVSPLSPSVAIFYIRALAATRQTELAIAKAQTALVAAPENSVLHDTLGSLQAQRQNWNDATIQFKEAVRLNPSFGEAHLHLGLALAMQQAPEALTELTTAAELLPQSALAQVELAKALLAHGDIAKAVTSLRRALTLNPSSLDTTYQLGLALQASGDERQAIPFFQQVITADPHNAPALTNLGLALVQTGKAKEAIPLYQRALKETPDNPLIHQDLGVAYLQASDLDDAAAEFRTGLTIAPGSYQLHYDLGLALKLKDDVSAAKAELELAARLNPNSPDPPYTLGILAMQTGQFEDAARQLKVALAVRPENGDGWAILGSVYKQQDKLAEASDALRKAIELIPNQPGPHITLAAVLAQQGQNSEAAGERKKAADLTRVAINRQRATFAANTSSALLLKGQVTDAIARYQEAVSDDPTYAEAHRGLAMALERAGRTAEAEGERNKASQLEQPRARPQPQ